MRQSIAARLFQRTSATSQTAEVPAEPQARLPFKEWSDKEMREEKWDDPKLISLREELIERFGQSHDYYHDQEPDRLYDQMHDYQQDDGYDYHRKNSSTRGSKNYREEKRRFQDPQVVQLPQSVKLHEWKEVSEVFPNAKLVVYIKNDEHPDLITDNKHLLHSEFMRNFISSIHTLIYLGNTTRFTTQFTGPNFSATTGDAPWRPWFHIYSNHSAGTRREHDPTINKIGKYVVRLFWLGTWRKIYVDDRLPVDIFQNILLPSVVKRQEETGEGSKVLNSQVVQLWPYVLAKALLKIASLTWFQSKEIVDFDIIHCLTGWIPQKINTVGLPISEVWKICWAYTRHYTCINEVPPEKGEELKTSKSGTQMVSGKEDRENNDTTSKESNEEKTKGSKDGLENDSCDLIKVVDKAESTHYVVARCNDLRTFDSDQKIQNFSPCWSHEFLVDQTRDGPLIKPRLTKDLENWKRLRWLSWAKKKGLVSEDDIRPENFHYKLVSAFRKVTEPVVCEQPRRLSSDQLSLESIEEFILARKEKKGKKLKKNVSYHRSISQRRSVSQRRSIPQQKNVTDRKQSKIKKNYDPKIASDEKIEKAAKQTESDPSFWVDYKDLSSQINTLTVYFKPCRMNTKIRISNLSNEGKWNVGMLSTWTLLQNPLTPKISRNEPIYIFSESLDPQFLVINLSQTGYTKILEPEEDEDIIVPPVESKTDSKMECDFCLASLVKRIKVNITKEEIKHYVSLDRFEPQVVTHDRSCSHIVLEKYNWETDKLGDTVTSLNTYGQKTATLQFGSGRTILKLWIKSDNPYVVFLFSDDPIVVGNLETILMCMTKESLLFKSKIDQISNSFSKLVSAFSTPELSLRLKEFYRSYKPEECLTKAECLMLHDTFFELMLELIKFTMGAEEMYAFRILLFRWQRNPHVEYPDCYDLCNCYDDDDLEYLKLLEKYIVLIQAFLRGTIDRYFMKHHNPTFAYHNILLESLHNIYTDIFSIENRFNACSDLVRALLAHPNLNKIKEKYQIYNDLENVLTVKKFTHNVSLLEGSWAPICRQQFFVNSDEPIPVKINLFCNHAEYVVRVIDNDTNNEIKRYTNNVTVSEYKKNEKGYTVFCYAWSTTSKQLSCNLCFTTKKEVQQDKLTISRVSTEVNSFYGMYIPNIDNRICKYSVGVWSESALLSAHLACSYPDVIIKLKVFDNEGKLLQEVMGKGDVVLPAIILEYRQKLDGRRSPSLTSVMSVKKRKRRQSMFPGSRLTFGSQQHYVPKGSDISISEGGSRSALNRDSNAKLRRKSLYSRKSVFSKKSNESQVGGSHTSIRSNESSTMFNGQGLRQDTPDLEYLQSLYDQHQEVRNIPKPRRGRYSMGMTDATPNLKFRSFTSRYTFGSQHALKAVPHVLPYENTPQKEEEKKKLRITHPTQYIIEVSLVNDSWPLSSEEWGNLERPVPDGHVSTFISSMKEIPRSSSRTSLRSKISVRSTRKSVFYGRKSLFLTPKASNMGEMFTGTPRKNQPQMGKPYWIMQTIVNHGQNVDISKHAGREMQMNSFKTKWSERDPTRAKRGQQIRAEFLRQNKLLNTERIFGEEIYTKRSLIKDDVSSYILPPLNLSRYMTKTVDADDRKFKNSVALEKEARVEAEFFEKAEDEWRDKCQRLDDFTNQQMINLNIVNKWYNGVRKKSYRMMESAMHMKIALYEALTGREFIADSVELEKRSKGRSFK